MGHRVLVASGETASTVGSGGSVQRFPPTGNIFNDRDVTGLRDIKIVASMSASANYSIFLRASFSDPSSGSVFKGDLDRFGPDSGLTGSATNNVIFSSDRKGMHFSWLDIKNNSGTSTLDVQQLGVIWESNNG